MLHSYCVGKLSIENGFDEFVYNLQTVICQDLARCAIPTFFAISGFLFFAKVNTIIDVLQGMKRRFFSLAIPFCIVNISYTVLEAIRWIVLRGESVETFLTGCNSIAEFLIRSVFLFHYNVVGWYLFTLMLWIGLTPLLYFVLKSKVGSVLALLFFTLLGVFEPFHIPYEKNYTLFFFFLGSFIAVYGIPIIDHPLERSKLWMPLLCFIVSQLLIAEFGYYITMAKILPVRFAFEVLISTSVWFLSDIFIEKVTVRSYYKYSFPIYLWHFTIISYASFFTEKIGLVCQDALDCLLCFMFYIGVGTLLPIWVAWYMERKMKPVYRLLTGGR